MHTFFFVGVQKREKRNSQASAKRAQSPLLPLETQTKTREESSDEDVEKTKKKDQIIIKAKKSSAERLQRHEVLANKVNACPHVDHHTKRTTNGLKPENDPRYLNKNACLHGA